MPHMIINYTLLQRYEILVKELYTEPKNEEILGTFLDSVITDVCVGGSN